MFFVPYPIVPYRGGRSNPPYRENPSFPVWGPLRGPIYALHLLPIFSCNWNPRRGSLLLTNLKNHSFLSKRRDVIVILTSAPLLSRWITAGTNYIFPCTLFVERKKSKTFPSLTFFVFILFFFSLTYANYF